MTTLPRRLEALERADMPALLVVFPGEHAARREEVEKAERAGRSVVFWPIAPPPVNDHAKA